MATAQDLALRDEAEDLDHGQKVRSTFVGADCFIDGSHRQNAQQQLGRFFDAWFGAPYASPNRDEHAMFQAKAAATRSADLSRQVGASIAIDGAIVAVGCNEVPAFGGGAYWEDDDHDARDFMRGVDANEQTRSIAVEEVRTILKNEGWLADSHVDDPAEAFASVLEGTRLDELTEFGRPVHAEMSAVLDAARRGVAVQGAWLYCTTFPCHNCAKHLVAAGFELVHFIEPYPKSLAEELHPDSVVIDPSAPDNQRLQFRPFVGVSPNIYLPLYERTGKRKTATGKALAFDRPTARPKLVEGWDSTYLEREGLLVNELAKRLEGAGEALSDGHALPDVGEDPPRSGGG